MKNEEKIMWVFIFQKYGKFWSISLQHSIKHKPLISEEWFVSIKYKFTVGIFLSKIWLFSCIWKICTYYIRTFSISHKMKYAVPRKKKWRKRGRVFYENIFGYDASRHYSRHFARAKTLPHIWHFAKGS